MHHATAFAIAASLLAATPAFAEEPCPGPDLVRSFIDVQSPAIAKVVSSQRVDEDVPSFKQVVTLKTGTKVSFEVLSVRCKVAAIRFLFDPVKSANPAKPQEFIKTARALFESVPINPQDEVFFRDARAAFAQPDLHENIQRASTGLMFQCGERQICAIEVKKPRKLEFGMVNMAAAGD